MGTVHVRFEMAADQHRALKHRAFDEGKPLSQLLRELVAAGVEKTAADAAAKPKGR